MRYLVEVNLSMRYLAVMKSDSGDELLPKPKRPSFTRWQKIVITFGSAVIRDGRIVGATRLGAARVET